MSKHTPGPWFIWQELAMQREGCDPEEITDELFYDHDHSIYAGIPKECTRGRLKGHTAHICDVDADNYDFDDDEDVSRATALANARLIAAAPELLEALRMWMGIHETPAGFEGKCGKALDAAISAQRLRIDAAANAARAAIAKSTGEPQ